MENESGFNGNDWRRAPAIEVTKKQYEDIEKLKTLIRNGKYILDCGHRVTLNHNLGSNIAIINGKDLRIICTLCLY
jgi:hypothetical protein